MDEELDDGETVTLTILENVKRVVIDGGFEREASLLVVAESVSIYDDDGCAVNEEEAIDERETWLDGLNSDDIVLDCDTRADEERAGDEDIDFETPGDEEIFGLRDTVMVKLTWAETEGEEVTPVVIDADDVSEHDAIDETLVITDGEAVCVNVFKDVFDCVIVAADETDCTEEVV